MEADATPEQSKRPASTISNAPPPPNLTRHIRKFGDQYLAGGGFGDVYRCRYLGGPTPLEVAVKALRFKSTLDGDTEDKSVKMLRRELGIWKRLSHDNIVPFLGVAYGFGMAGAMSLVSLWMPNETLHKFLSIHNDKLNMVHRLQILLDIATGLHYLHSFPIVHGDLNSNNVLLDADYTARIADFGYASLAGNIPEAMAYLQRSTTRPGSLRWIAPEQISLEGTFDRTAKSDIYSFGCIALEGSSLDANVLSGKQPWSEVREDTAVVLHLHLGHKPGRPESQMINDSLWNFVQCCWSSSQERPGTDTILLSMKQFLNDCPSSSPLRDLFNSSLSQTNANPGGNVQKRYPPMGSAKWTGSVADLWSKIKRDSSSISNNDIVVFVIGPTGSGKSWFTREATNSELVVVNRSQHASTGGIQVIRGELTDEARKDSSLQGVSNIVFVDTPSFLTGYSRLDTHKEFEKWFGKVEFDPRAIGVVYMHRIETDPAFEPIGPHLEEFSQIPWPSHVGFPRQVHIVTSHDKTSGIMPKHKIAERTLRLRAQARSLPQSAGRWRPSVHNELFCGEAEVAWRAVEKLWDEQRLVTPVRMC